MHHLPSVRLFIPEDFVRDLERFKKFNNINSVQRPVCLYKGSCLTFRFAAKQRRSRRTKNCQSLLVADVGLAKEITGLMSLVVPGNAASV
jgi:hypothetical protein